MDVASQHQMADSLDLQLPSGTMRALRHGAGTGVPVLCAPGLSANARSFDSVARTLVARGRPVVALDLRGRGFSPPTAPGTYGWRRHAEDVLAAAVASALCFVLPSQREGYGLVVVESSARGIPSVVVSGPDNAATELVEDGVNGVIAASASPQDLAAAIVRVHEAGDAMRASTCAWFAANAQRLSLASSLETVVASY